MKTLLVVFISLQIVLCYSSRGQANLPIDEKTGKAVYTEVVQVPETDHAELYARALNWFQTFFPNPASVIKEKDALNGKITGQHGMYIFKTLKDKTQFKAGQVKFMVEIQVKEGRYKYQVDDIFKFDSPKVYIEEWLDESAPDKEAQFGYLKQVDTQINDMIGSLKEAMGKPVEQETGEDW